MIENGAEVYNTLDDIEKLSQYYGKNCEYLAKKHAKKAYLGFIGTLGVSLVGGLYTLIHHRISAYHDGASRVYEKYSNVIEDSDKLEAELRDLRR